MKNDSPARTLRFSDFMKPPSAFDSTWTPPEWAIIAPASARHSSPGPRLTRQTANAGLCRTVISIRVPPGVASDHVLPAERSPSPGDAAPRQRPRSRGPQSPGPRSRGPESSGASVAGGAVHRLRVGLPLEISGAPQLGRVFDVFLALLPGEFLRRLVALTHALLGGPPRGVAALRHVRPT